MSRTKELMFEMERENHQRQENLLALPKSVDSIKGLLECFDERLTNTELTLEQLAKSHKESQKWHVRFREWIFAGVVGAVISLVLTVLLM
jgi:hypothetical protein